MQCKKNNTKYDIDLNTITKALMSNEAIIASEYIEEHDEIFSIEAMATIENSEKIESEVEDLLGKLWDGVSNELPMIAKRVAAEQSTKHRILDTTEKVQKMVLESLKMNDRNTFINDTKNIIYGNSSEHHSRLVYIDIGTVQKHLRMGANEQILHGTAWGVSIFMAGIPAQISMVVNMLNSRINMLIRLIKDQSHKSTYQNTPNAKMMFKFYLEQGFRNALHSAFNHGIQKGGRYVLCKPLFRIKK